MSMIKIYPKSKFELHSLSEETMSKNQSNNENEDCKSVTGTVANATVTDWEVDREGIAYNVNENFLTDFADLKDEFKESS